MSVAPPKHELSKTYILTTLQFYQAKIDEITGSITSNEDILSRVDWYSEKIGCMFGKIENIGKYSISKSSQPLQNAISIVTQTFKDTAALLEVRVTHHLHERVENYTNAVNNSKDRDIVHSHKEILKTFKYFGNFISELNENVSNTSAQSKLEETNELLKNTSASIKQRIRSYEYKLADGEKHLFPQHLYIAPTRIFINKPSDHRPSRNYFLARAKYREARINEFGLYLRNQKNASVYKIWFQNALDPELYRVRKLEGLSSKCGQLISVEIEACKAAFIRIHEQINRISSES